MKDYQKTTLLDSLYTMETRIEILRHTIASIAKDDHYTDSQGETIATYAARLNGLLQKRRGFCYALNILGYIIKWDGDHAVDITEET